MGRLKMFKERQKPKKKGKYYTNKANNYYPALQKTTFKSMDTWKKKNINEKCRKMGKNR